ncbi:ribokinase [Arthrobacter sp. M4]|uniref:ribokinase n=1 Tax=Arthrobacter sp. M4 TaxID=218160 RepID=UPI001CDD1C12|nr:ribokinase [Arthrobacter sp. M4]MCA4132608.1 ribokinase [Arthrobacter sp. M4]
MSTVVLGSANRDLVYRVERIPSPGETVLAASVSVVAGGKGNNQAIAAARSGAEVTFIVALGTDEPGDRLAAEAAAAGVTLQARRVTEPTGTAIITVDDNGENAIVVNPGANRLLEMLNVGENAAIAGAHVLVLQLETPMSAVIGAANAARAASTTVVLNASPIQPLPAGLLASIDVLIVNEHEARHLAAQTRSNQTQNEDENALASALSELGPAVILTLGPRGAIVCVPGELPVLVPGRRVAAVDTTGAGDTFCGALAAKLDQETRGTLDLGALIRAAEFATTAAAISVQRHGAVPSIPTLEEIRHFHSIN